MPPTTPPEANHRIVIAGQAVAYKLKRSARRTIGLAIDHRGLRVGAPLRARQGDIEALIQQHGQWVLDKLATWRDRPAAIKLPVIEGTRLTILGVPLILTVTPLGRARWQWQADRLHLWPTTTVNAAQLLERALRDKAREVFAQRLALYAPRLGVAPPPLRLSSARTRWGSCSHRGGISLNWRLLFMPMTVVDYVVCHELAHLREMNHSPRFWAVVEHLYPDWKIQRLNLRRLAREIPQF